MTGLSRLRVGLAAVLLMAQPSWSERSPKTIAQESTAGTDNEPRSESPKQEAQQRIQVTSKGLTQDPRAGRDERGGLLSAWDTERRRWFLSARADLGFLFFRPRVSGGFGVPHRRWWGADLVPILSGAQAGFYSGLRVRTPRVELRSGVLFSGAFFRGRMEPKTNYDERDLELRTGTPASYWASDTELTLSAPLGPTYLQLESQLMYLPAEGNSALFVETLGVVVVPPWALREHLSWSFPSGLLPGLFWGPVVESVWVPGREDAWVVRAGGSVRFWLYQDVQLRTDVVPTVFSPDTLGRAGASWLQLNLRLLWATN